MKKRTNLLVLSQQEASEQTTFSFKEDIAIHCKRLYRFLFGMCRDEELSKDLLQDTLLQAQCHINQGILIEKGLIWCWLKAIAKNTLFKHYRQRRMQQNKLAEQKRQICDNLGWNTPASTPEAPWEDEGGFTDAVQKTREKMSDNIDMLLKSHFRFLELTQAERNLITERHLRMKSFKEISCAGNESISTVMSRYYATMKKVQRQLINWEKKGLLSGPLDLKELRRIRRAENAAAVRKARKQKARLPKSSDRL